MKKGDGSSNGNGRVANQNVAGGGRPNGPRHVLRNSCMPVVPKGRPIRCFHCKKLGHRRDQWPQLVRNKPVTLPRNNGGSATRSQKSIPTSQVGQ
jgi:hypothetical protein